MRRRILSRLEDKIAASHTAILVIDMQNAFFAEGSTLGDAEEKRALIPRLQQFIVRARAKHINLAFIRMVQTTDDTSRRMRSRPNRRRASFGLSPGSRGAEFLPEFQPQAKDIVVEKTRYNAFLDTPLDERLQSRGIRTLVVTGVYTNVCVGTTAQHASMRNYYVVVPSDLAVGTDRNLHESYLSNIGRFFGTVTTSDELLQIWESKPESANKSGLQAMRV